MKQEFDATCSHCDTPLKVHALFDFGIWPEEFHKVSQNHANNGTLMSDDGNAQIRMTQGTIRINCAKGRDLGSYSPCYGSSYKKGGEDIITWVCRREGPTDPCDEDFLRKISS